MDHGTRSRLPTNSMGGDNEDEEEGDTLGDLIAIAARASAANPRAQKRRRRPNYRLEVALSSKMRQEAHNGGYTFPLLTLRKVEKQFVPVKDEYGEKVVDAKGKAVTEKKVGGAYPRAGWYLLLLGDNLCGQLLDHSNLSGRDANDPGAMALPA